MFVLVYWVHRAKLECQVQMEHWDRTVIDINATCDTLGAQSLQILYIALHVLSGCDITLYHYGKK